MFPGHVCIDLMKQQYTYACKCENVTAFSGFSKDNNVQPQLQT